jgi:hypothetical protein
MEEVNPLELIPGETYYLEEKRFDIYYKKNGFSSRGKGEFVKYEENVNGTSAKFKNIESVNNKPFYFLPDFPDKPNISTFHVAPYGSGYKIYKPLRDDILTRKDKELRVKAFEKMINQEKLPMLSNAIDISTMFDKRTTEHNGRAFIEDDPTFYGSEPDKSSLGTQLKDIYGSSLLNKKTAGRRRRKTRKSRKSRKTKSRRRR